MNVKSKAVLLPRLNIELLQEESLFFLAEAPSTDGSLLDLMAKYFLMKEPLIRKIVQHPNVLENTIQYLRMFGDPSYQEFMKAKTDSSPVDPESGPDSLNLFQQVQQMKVSEKIQLALKGNKEARALLMKESNKQVLLAILSSPRLTEQEVEVLALSKTVSEEILRLIANNRTWIRNYSIVTALVNNPKTPVGLSLGFIKILKARELGGLSKNKGVPEVIRSSAHKMLQLKKSGS